MPPSHESFGRALAGTVAVVTGSAQGVGKAVALAAAQAGAEVLLVDLNAAGAEKAVAEVAKAGEVRAESLALDITLPDAGDRILKSCIEKFGRADALFLCAGIYPSASLEDTTDEMWDRVHTLNLKSAFRICRAFAPHFKQQRSGKIVITSSVTGNKVTTQDLTAYAASKGGVNGLVKGLAMELAPWGINVNCVEPGLVLTEGIHGLLSAEDLAKFEVEIPSGKGGDPKWIADAMLFFATPAAKFCNGTSLVVDGGSSLKEFPYAVAGKIAPK
ncbi:3-oxoacyl-reductase [Hyaloraphidium curvatum]|nr:3-oxoacyl-reductase [Hyaloraphidium curvatum]